MTQSLAPFTPSETARVRQQFVELATAAADSNAREGRDKSVLAVEFSGGSNGLQSALRVVASLQAAELVTAGEPPASYEPLAGSEAKIGSATIKAHAGGLVALSFTPPEAMGGEELVGRMAQAASAARATAVPAKAPRR